MGFFENVRVFDIAPKELLSNKIALEFKRVQHGFNAGGDPKISDDWGNTFISRGIRENVGKFSVDFFNRTAGVPGVMDQQLQPEFLEGR